MKEFISWVRYVELEGDKFDLFKNNYQKLMSEKNQDSAANDLEAVFAMNKMSWGLDNDIKVWLKIDSLADELLSKYDTTYDKDLKNLE